MIKQWSLIMVVILLLAAVCIAAAGERVVMEIEGMTCSL